MGIFDRGGDGEAGEAVPADADGTADAGPDGGSESRARTDGGASTEEAGPNQPQESSYIPYSRQNPPQAVKEQLSSWRGGVDEEVYDVLDDYTTEEGTIREDVLSLPRHRLEEWREAEEAVGSGKLAGRLLNEVIEARTVGVTEELLEDDFFSTAEGFQTLTNRYDLERAVPVEKKQHFTEVNRYWVNKPYSFIIVFHSTKENETKYYAIEPHLTPIEQEVKEFLNEKLRAAIKYETDDVLTAGDEEDIDVRANVIERETRRLLKRFDLYSTGSTGESTGGIRQRLNPLASKIGVVSEPTDPAPRRLEGLEARPESVLIEEDAQVLSEYQVEKLLYYLKRDFVGYERIDAIKHDINVEDISCDGYNSPVFVYHTDHENIITNVYHGDDELDSFVVKLAQRSGKGISKRTPQVDATLPDGSRAQLTLGFEVSDHGTNYTIRQFKDVPFTPVDLINWRTFSLDQMAFLWLAIENEMSLIFAGGTASGKTTSLNAVSLFIPSNTKIVSIEDTREVELPQRNWIASVTRPSFSDDQKGDIDEFDLLEAALRQRPDYIVMGEVRGEEGRTLFQVMSTGHTSYTTFHADTVGEVLKRFTTEPINVSKTLFTALDLVSTQRQTRVKGQKVRRASTITEINEYNAENDEINVKDIYQWRADEDEFEQVGDSNLLDQIMFDRGWDEEKLNDELEKRRLVLAYLIDRGLNQYAQVAATLQSFMSDPETLLSLVAHDALKDSLEDLREMESVEIDIDPEMEALVPRPEPSEDIRREVEGVLDTAEDEFLEDYRGTIPETGALGRMLKNSLKEAQASGSGEAEQGFEEGFFDEIDAGRESVIGADGGREGVLDAPGAGGTDSPTESVERDPDPGSEETE